MRIGCQYGDKFGILELSDENFRLVKEQDKSCLYHFDDENKVGDGVLHNM